MAKQKSSAKAKKGKLSTREGILLFLVAVLIIALAVSLIWGDSLNIIIGNNTPESPDSGADTGSKNDGLLNKNDGYLHTSVLSGISDISLPSEFDPDNCLEIHFIDIGQGDAIAILFPDGKNMLIDAGSGTSVSTATKTEYLAYLSDNLNISDTIDYMIITHPDADHVNMASAVLDKYDVKNIYYNDHSYAEPTKTYSTFLEKAATEPDAQTYPIGADPATYTVSGDNYSIDIYASGYNQFLEEATVNKNKNILSIMCLLTYGERKVMFTGDAEVPTEQYFMDTLGGEAFDVDVLKIGHHGSSSCTSEQFLDYLTPEYAVISCDDGQMYHHPHPETMNRLFDYGITTYRTNRHGDIVLYIDLDGDFGFLPENYVPVENNTKNENPRTIILDDEAA